MERENLLVHNVERWPSDPDKPVIANSSMNTPIELGDIAMSAMLEAESTMTGSRTGRMPHRSISHPTNGIAIADEIAAIPPAAEMLARSQPNSWFSGLMNRPNV